MTCRGWLSASLSSSHKSNADNSDDNILNIDSLLAQAESIVNNADEVLAQFPVEQELAAA